MDDVKKMNFENKRFVKISAALSMLFTLLTTTIAFPAEDTINKNNLSFPAIAVDGFGITKIASPSFTTEYTGPYNKLTPAEIAVLVASGPWYAQQQQELGNEWQAEFENRGSEAVTIVDWGDNIESFDPAVNKPFRLEVTLYKDLGKDALGGDITMEAYNMAVLSDPSSPDELQGTNKVTYDSKVATVVSGKPKLVVQYLTENIPEGLNWDSTNNVWTYTDSATGKTVTPTVIPVSFAPELNVGGKYIFGASQGGFTPTKKGYYRVTFYMPKDSSIDITAAAIGELDDEGVLQPTVALSAEGGGGGLPRIDADNNLTYVDINAVAAKGGSNKPGKPGNPGNKPENPGKK